MAVQFYKEMENQEKWREFAQCKIQQLADQDKVLFHLFGFGRLPVPTSYWSTTALQVYGGFEAMGTPTYSETEQGDVFMAGGDVIVSREGKVVYSFRTPLPYVRPDVADILAVLEKMRQ